MAQIESPRHQQCVRPRLLVDSAMSPTNPFDAYRMDDRVVVVTGAASGIGAETCAVLGAAGATVVCADVDVDGLAATVAAVEAEGGTALAVPTDVTVRADGRGGRRPRHRRVRSPRRDVQHRRRDVPGLIEDLDDDMIDRGIALNLKGVLYGTQYAIRAMKGAGRGSIVNVSSAAIDAPYPGIGVYAFTKAAVAMLTMTAALEAGEHGIRVNVIAPGLGRHPVHHVAVAQARRHPRPGGVRRVHRDVEDASRRSMSSVSRSTRRS